MKTIIQVWTHKCVNHIQNNVDGFWGIGDILRGTIKLYQLCKKYNYKYIVDIRLHSISNFLNQMENPHAQLILDNGNNIEFVYPGDVENYINIRDTCEIIYFFTNDFCDESIIDEDTKIFVQNLLLPNIDFESYLNTKINNIPYEYYNIIHFRLGDNELVRGNNDNLNKYLNIFLNNKINNDILMSDSLTLKNEIKKITNTFTFDINPVHIGYSKNIDSFKNTLVDFFIMKKAKEIKTYSIYSWISGFTYWIGKIYDIPLININNQNSFEQKKYFHTFGNERFYGALKRIQKQVEEFNVFNALFIYNDNDLKKDIYFWTKHSNFIENNPLRFYGYAIWKPYLILKSLEKINYGDILVNSDAGCEWNINGTKRLQEYFDIINSNEKSILCFQLNHLEKSWTKMDLIDYLNSYSILNTKQIMDTTFIIKKNEKTVQFITEWYEISCNYHYIDDSNSNIENDPDFKEHRHDQSVFSLLCKKYDVEILDDETFYWPWTQEDKIKYIKNPILAARNNREDSIIDFT